MGARMALDMRRGTQESWESRTPLEPLGTSSNPDELWPGIEGDPSCRSESRFRVARRNFGPLLRTGRRYVQGVRLTVSRHVSQGQEPLHLTLREMQVSQARFGGMVGMRWGARMWRCWRWRGYSTILGRFADLCEVYTSLHNSSNLLNETTYVELYFQSPPSRNQMSSRSQVGPTPCSLQPFTLCGTKQARKITKRSLYLTANDLDMEPSPRSKGHCVNSSTSKQRKVHPSLGGSDVTQ